MRLLKLAPVEGCLGFKHFKGVQFILVDVTVTFSMADGCGRGDGHHGDMVDTTVTWWTPQ